LIVQLEYITSRSDRLDDGSSNVEQDAKVQSVVVSSTCCRTRKHLAEREVQRAKNSTGEQFSQRLIANGVPEQAIQEAVKEMRAAR
jgi:hypothetical protein